jgi:hypothetical protein
MEASVALWPVPPESEALVLRLSLAGFAAALLVLPSSLAAQEFAGRWEMTRETPRGSVTQTLTLTRDGDAWSGTMDFMRREVAVQEVRVEGDRLTFTVEMTMGRPGGGEGRTLVQTFTGTLEGDEISGEMETPRGAMPMVWKRATD